MRNKPRNGAITLEIKIIRWNSRITEFQVRGKTKRIRVRHVNSQINVESERKMLKESTLLRIGN